MRLRAYKPVWSYWWIAAFVLLLCGIAQAQEIEGTWKLASRKFADGTTQVPPAVQGAATWHNGLYNLFVIGHTPEGKPWSFSLLSSYKLDATEWTETLLVSVLDDGSGKPPVYNLTEETKTAPVTREGQQIAFQSPFSGPPYVFDGDKFTANCQSYTKCPGAFVDSWERVR